MGLLDEAIREHLELKRRRGGDPTEIAREEREALEPVPPSAAGPDDGAPHGAAGDPLPAAGSEASAPELSALGPSAEAGDFGGGGEETAELDMQSVLGAEEMLTEEHRAPLAPSAEQDEEFEWEAPRGGGERQPEVDPGQERMSFE